MASLLDLSENALEGVLLSPAADLRSLGRLAGTCRALRQPLAEPVFLRRLAVARTLHSTMASSAGTAAEPAERAGHPDGDQDEDQSEWWAAHRSAGPEFALSAVGVDSLEALAVLEAVRDLGRNHIVFHLASLVMVDGSFALLEEYARLMDRHPRLRMRVESHTGVGAPPSIAPQHSMRRALVVLQQLWGHGIGEDRVSANAWGMDVGRRERWPPTKEFARAEVYVAFAHADGFPVHGCWPSWPSYYEGIEPQVAAVEDQPHAGETLTMLRRPMGGLGGRVGGSLALRRSRQDAGADGQQADGEQERRQDAVAAASARPWRNWVCWPGLSQRRRERKAGGSCDEAGGGGRQRGGLTPPGKWWRVWLALANFLLLLFLASAAVQPPDDDGGAAAPSGGGETAAAAAASSFHVAAYLPEWRYEVVSLLCLLITRTASVKFA